MVDLKEILRIEISLKKKIPLKIAPFTSLPSEKQQPLPLGVYLITQQKFQFQQEVL